MKQNKSGKNLVVFINLSVCLTNIYSTTIISQALLGLSNTNINEMGFLALRRNTWPSQKKDE